MGTRSWGRCVMMSGDRTARCPRLIALGKAGQAVRNVSCGSPGLYVVQRGKEEQRMCISQPTRPGTSLDCIMCQPFPANELSQESVRVYQFPTNTPTPRNGHLDPPSCNRLGLGLSEIVLSDARCTVCELSESQRGQIMTSSISLVRMATPFQKGMYHHLSINLDAL